MSHNEHIRILIADDHAIVREGLRSLIETEPGMELVGEAADGFEAIRLARKLMPDVILLDLIMPRQDGLSAIVEIKRDVPEARILVLTSFAEDEKVMPAIRAGALGYLLKDASPQELLNAVRAVHQGQAALHPAIARRLISEFQQSSADSPGNSNEEMLLTPREIEVLTLVGQGLTNQQIARRLVITERTARTHVSNILAKLHLPNRTQAARYALRHGLSRLDSD